MKTITPGNAARPGRSGTRSHQVTRPGDNHWERQKLATNRVENQSKRFERDGAE
jgi:hypothetical protein